MIKLTLGTDSTERKNIQLVAACLRYIPAALREFALHAKAGNDKHNPGQPIHHARGKSMDHEECILRHLVDLQDIRAFMERNQPPGRAWLPDDEIVRMLINEARAEFWRAGVFLQELCETYLGDPLAPGAVEPAPPSVPEGTGGWPGLLNPEGEDFNASAFLQEFAAPSDPAKLPQIVDGAPWREPWAIVDGNGNLLSLHSSHADASACMGVMMAPEPVNTPEELAELVKMQGVVRLVGGPGLVDGGHVEHPPVICSTPGCWGNPGHEGAHLDLDGKTVPDLAAESAGDVAFVLPPYLDEAEQSRVDALSDRDEQAMRGHGIPDEAPLDRCGQMSNTKRVCTRAGGHAGAHSDDIVLWAGIE